MVIPLNWMPILQWFIAKFVLEMGTKKTCVTIRLNYELKIDTILGSIANAIGRTYVIIYSGSSLGPPMTFASDLCFQNLK